MESEIGAMLKKCELWWNKVGLDGVTHLDAVGSDAVRCGNVLMLGKTDYDVFSRFEACY